MKQSTRYFQSLGVNIFKSQLESLFASDVADVPALCAIILKGDPLPKMYRSRAWLHLLLNWKAFSSFSFLSQQLQSKFADLQRVTLLLSEEAKKKDKKAKKKKPERVAEMLEMLKVQQRMSSNKAIEATQEELEAMLNVFMSVFPDDDALAFYCFQKRLLTSKAEVNSLCNRTMELLGTQDAVDDKTLKSWFRSLFVVVWQSDDDSLLYLDILFASENFQSFLCATAVALVKLNLRPDVLDFKVASPISEVIRFDKKQKYMRF